MPFRAAIFLAAISWLCASPAFPQAPASGVVTLQDKEEPPRPVLPSRRACSAADPRSPPSGPASRRGSTAVSTIRSGAPPRASASSSSRSRSTARRRPRRPKCMSPMTARNLYFGIHAHYSDLKLIRANRVDRDQTGRDDTVRVYIDPFLDQQRAYVFSVNGYGIQSDSVLRGSDATGGALGARITAGPRTGKWTANAARSAQAAVRAREPHVRRRQPQRRAGGRVMGRAIRLGRTIGRRRLDRGDGDSVQEPALSLARRGRGAPLGLSDRAHHRQQERERRLGADLPKRDGHTASDGCARRHDRPVDEPQPRAAADVHGDQRTDVRRHDRHLPGRRTSRRRR